ncbi:MAG: tRNA glutamyl-Q(34) synthetase GluQRS [Myxococcales bacterium]|nr:tRNA glutamyl-Q(34) synthetase GluQRS [Myxococcales bacterium]
MSEVATRFAPSPTGDLHLGGALCAVMSFAAARRQGGRFVVRMEDLDPPRVVPGAALRILQDLQWLGLDWDEGPAASAGEAERGPHGPYVQSLRSSHYEAAIAELTEKGLVYPCDCSRAEIARVASAPHAGEELVYPGTCRDRDPARPMKRAPALRVRVPRRTIAFDDALRGHVEQDLAEISDFVLMRGDGVFAYQLAVLVDDVAMKITDVIRGDDLLSSTPRQLWLAEALGLAQRAPRYMHLPMVTDASGQRLEKRSRGSSIAMLRDAGVAAEEVLGALAHALGLTDRSEPVSAAELRRLTPQRPPHSMRVPSAWATR